MMKKKESKKKREIKRRKLICVSVIAFLTHNERNTKTNEENKIRRGQRNLQYVLTSFGLFFWLVTRSERGKKRETALLA